MQTTTHGAAAATLLVACLLGTAAVQAGQVQVHVVDATARAPLAGAAVCLGTPADPDQFGAVRSNESGDAVFDGVPLTPLLLTVSRDQYRGYRQRHSAKRFDVVIEVALPTGGLGPACDAPLALPPGDASRLAINAFSVNAGRIVTRRRSVAIAAEVAGNPTHFRVSETPDFRDADWQPYPLPGEFRLSDARGTKTVYFQVRRFRDAGSASLQSLSDVARARVMLQ